MINLEELKFIGRGGHKYVYQHPEDDSKVIKVMIPDRATDDGGRADQPPIRAHRQQGIYRQFRREIIQYLQLCKTYYKQNKSTFPIEKIYGFQTTSLGLGLVTEKIESPFDKPMTIEQIVKEGLFNEDIRVAFNKFFDDCCKYHVVFGEVNLGGIMYTESRQGKPEFVLVDGIGDKNIIPFRAWFKSINDKKVRKVENKLKQQLREIDSSIQF